MPRFNCQNIIKDSGVDFLYLKTINAEINMFLLRNRNYQLSMFFDFCETFFADCNLAASFERPCLIIVDENIDTAVLCNLHLWLLNKTCNIKNIVMLSLSTLGKNKWYEAWCDLHGFGQRRMKIVELPWFYQTSGRYFESLPKQPVKRELPLKWYFSFYAGTHSMIDNSLATALISSTATPCYVSYLGGYIQPHSELENLAEVYTGWVDSPKVQKLMDVIKLNAVNQQGVKDEIVNFSGFQWQIDQQCAAQIVRESLISSQWYATSEKTLRAFLHGQIVVPVSGPAAKDQLSEIGFQFVDVFDYDNYQYKNNWFERYQAVLDQFEDISQKYSLKDLEEILQSNQHITKYNYEYIESGDLEKFLYNKALKELRNE